MAIDPNIEETRNRLNTAAAGGAPLSTTDQAGISGVTEAQYREAAQSDKNIGVNSDAIIGGILNQRSAVTTSAPAADKLEGYGADINNAEASLTGVSREEAAKSWAAAGNDATGWMQNADGSWKPPVGYTGPPSPTTTGTTTSGSGLTQTQEEAMRMGRQSNEQMYNAQEQDIRVQTNQAMQQAETAQRGAVGAERAFFARTGAFMASTAALQYSRATEEKYQQKVSQIRAAGLNALQTARAAKSDADFKLLDKQMTLVRQNVQDIQDAKEEQRKEIEFANKLRDYDKQDLAETFDALAADGVEELPDAYANAVDEQMGYTPGTSKGLFKIAKDLRGAKTAEMQMSLANDLQKVLKSVPVGTPIKIGEHTYYGTSGTGSIEMDEDGNARTITVDQATGKVSVQELGKIGKPKDGWVFKEDAAGNPFFVNERTRQIKPGYPEPAGWGDILPDGTNLSTIIDPDDGGFFSGECGEYARLVSGVRVGDKLKDKMALVDKSISIENVTNGDCFIMDVGTGSGHIAVVSEVVSNPDGSKSIRFSDANWDNKGTVRNNQIIKADDPRLKGFISGEPRGAFASGSDSKGWVSKDEATDKKERVLSASEAQALGVPFGTTAKDAYGKMPTGKPTVEESKARQFAVAAENANKILGEVGYDVGVVEWPRPNLMKTPQRQKFEQAARAFVNATLRRESGATITDSEFSNKYKELIDQGGDSVEVKEQKKLARAAAVKSIQEAGRNGIQTEGDGGTPKILVKDGIEYDASAYSLSEIQQAMVDGYTLK